MFRNSFGLPNLLARTNKLGLFLVFHNSMNMLGFNGVFAMTNKIFFMKIYNIVEYDLTILNMYFYPKNVCFIYLLLFSKRLR